MVQATQRDPYREAWIEWMVVSRGHLPNTLRLYTRVVDHAYSELGDLAQLTPDVLEEWVQSKGGSASSIGNRCSALTSYYRFLVKRRIRLDNPAVEIDRPQRRKGVPRPVRDLAAALDLLDHFDVRANEKTPSLRRRVGETRDMAVFMAETGLRVHEACAVVVDIPAPETITIIGKGHKESIVLLTPAAREALDRLGGRIGLGARAVQRRFERADFHPHQLRHWRATSLVQAGVELGTVSKIMRHSSPAITMVYAEYAQDQMRDALAQVDTVSAVR